MTWPQVDGSQQRKRGKVTKHKQAYKLYSIKVHIHVESKHGQVSLISLCLETRAWKLCKV